MKYLSIVMATVKYMEPATSGRSSSFGKKINQKLDTLKKMCPFRTFIIKLKGIFYLGYQNKHYPEDIVDI